ncbi:MAG: flagellar type III secretion system pore protein FliP, partial [Idiomarina loihiensis]
MNRWLLLSILAVLCLLPEQAFAWQDLTAVTVKTNPDGSEEYSVTLQILAIMTALTFIPAMVIMMTS